MGATTAENDCLCGEPPHPIRTKTSTFRYCLALPGIVLAVVFDRFLGKIPMNSIENCRKSDTERVREVTIRTALCTKMPRAMPT